MTESDQPQSDAAAAEMPASARVLLRAVYIMGVVLVLLMIALVVGIVWKASRTSSQEAQWKPAQFDLGLAADEAVTAVSPDGDRLIVTTSRGIIVVDLRKNRVEARIAHRP